MKRPVRLLLRLFPVGILALLLVGGVLVTLVRIERTVEAGGEILVERYEIVRAAIPGRIENLQVDAGDWVQRGDVLARLVDPDLDRQRMNLEREIVLLRSEMEKHHAERDILFEDIHPVEATQQRFQQHVNDLEKQISAARIVEAQLQQQATEEGFERAQKLSDLGLISDQELRQAEQEKLLALQRVTQKQLEEQMTQTRTTELDHARHLLAGEHKRQIRALELAMEQNESLLEKRLEELARVEHTVGLQTLRATLNGVVVTLPPKDLLGRQLKAGEELLTIADVESIHFHLEIPEQAIVRVRSGQKAFIEIFGLPKHQFKVFTGQVETVAQRGTFDGTMQNATHYPVQIHLEEPWILLGEDRFFLRHGMRGMAKISYRQDLPILTAFYEFLVGTPSLPDTGNRMKKMKTANVSKPLPGKEPR